LYRERPDLKRSDILPSHSDVTIRKTICDICNPVSHCGIDAHVRDGVVVKVEGTRENPHSAGTLCAKGAAVRQYIYHPDRIRTPLLNTGSKASPQFKPVSWETAMDILATRLLDAKKESGPESVVFYAGYPKWMRPFLKRLAHGFGSPNYCSESSTCSAAAAMASRLNYGTVGRPDLPHTRCLLVWSANPFYSNTSVARKLMEAKARGVKIIEVGPLITPLTRLADIHLRLRPGTSGALALGMARVIISENLYDLEFVENWTTGFAEFRDYVEGFPPETVAAITGVPAEKIVRAARLYATTAPAAMWNGPQATVHHTNGVQNHRAITALIGLTGNFDRKGGNHVVPPAYLYVANGMKTRQSEFEQSRPWPHMASRIGEDRYPVWCRMVAEAQAVHLPFQIRTGKPYPVRAMLAFGLNHRMWPGSDFMAESLKRLDFLAVADLFMTDSARMADLVLPACSSFERSELKLYPGGYAIWTAPAIAPLGESRPDNDIISDLARRIVPEDTLLCSGHEACMDWILAPSGLTVSVLGKHPAGMQVEGIRMPEYRKYEKNGFSTPSGKMELASGILAEYGQDPLPRFQEPQRSPFSTPEEAKRFSLILTTGARLPMFIHSRTFRMPWTRELRPDPMVDIHPSDAEKRMISQGDPVHLTTARGSILVKANLTETVFPGMVNMYHGYPEADVNRLIEPDYLDPISGYPGFKSLLCEVRNARDSRAAFFSRID
jgi:anaerobic selenocysteine-containing dehydrogenase